MEAHEECYHTCTEILKSQRPSTFDSTSQEMEAHEERYHTENVVPNGEALVKPQLAQNLLAFAEILKSQWPIIFPTST